MAETVAVFPFSVKQIQAHSCSLVVDFHRSIRAHVSLDALGKWKKRILRISPHFWQIAEWVSHMPDAASHMKSAPRMATHHFFNNGSGHLVASIPRLQYIFPIPIDKFVPSANHQWPSIALKPIKNFKKTSLGESLGITDLEKMRRSGALTKT